MIVDVCAAGMTMDDIRDYEKTMHAETNKKVAAGDLVVSDPNSPTTPTNTPTETVAQQQQLEERLQQASLEDTPDDA